MRIEDSKYRLIVKKKITIEEGDFYIFDDFVVSEIKEGAIFNWECAEGLIEQIYEYFGSRDIRVAYISNRINSYSIYPQDWLKFFKSRQNLTSIAVVTKNRTGLSNFIFEMLFVKTKLQKFTSLDEAIIWAKKQSKKALESA